MDVTFMVIMIMAFVSHLIFEDDLHRKNGCYTGNKAIYTSQIDKHTPKEPNNVKS